MTSPAPSITWNASSWEASPARMNASHASLWRTLIASSRRASKTASATMTRVTAPSPYRIH
jgi:hypothetical protein